jgi:hypothetical protein
MRKQIKSKNTANHGSTRKGDRKPLGTRMGTLQDWREGSGKISPHRHQRRNTLRDGR